MTKQAGNGGAIECQQYEELSRYSDDPNHSQIKIGSAAETSNHSTTASGDLRALRWLLQLFVGANVDQDDVRRRRCHAVASHHKWRILNPQSYDLNAQFLLEHGQEERIQICFVF